MKARESVASNKKGNGSRIRSVDTENFDTMMETPTALRYASNSILSTDSKRGRKGKKGKDKVGAQACCGSGPEGGGCYIF